MDFDTHCQNIDMLLKKVRLGKNPVVKFPKGCDALDIFLLFLDQANRPLSISWLPRGGPDWDDYWWNYPKKYWRVKYHKYGPFLQESITPYCIEFSKEGVKRLISIKKQFPTLEKNLKTFESHFCWITTRSLASIVWPILSENNLEILKLVETIKSQKKRDLFTNMYSKAQTSNPEKTGVSADAYFQSVCKVFFAEYAADQSFNFNNWVELSGKGWSKFLGIPPRSKSLRYGVF